MRNNEVENNTINLSGTVSRLPEYSHEVYGEKFYQFMMDTNRTSGQADTLPITVSERLIDLSELQVGVTVEVSGQIRTYNKHEETKNRLIISVFARELDFLEETEGLYFPDTNQVYLTGFVCKEPNYRKTPLGREIADVLLAINRPYGKSDYVPGIAWGRNAKFASGLQNGTKLEIQGRLQSRVYQKRISETETEEHVAYEVSISKLEVLE